MTSRLTGALFALALVAGPLGAQDRAALNLVTHSQIWIDRPAAAIWPHILDPSRWKQGAKLTHRSGLRDQVGEVLVAVMPDDPAAAAFLVENVELVAPVRRTIKLYAPSGALMGYASWTLAETGGRTSVGYDVFSETLLGDAGKSMAPDAIRRAERQEWDTNKKRFDAELMALKSLVERR
jgi:hypothetical protein